MYPALLHSHSGLRWILLLLLILTIITALSKSGNKTQWTEKDKKISLFTLIFTHLQFVLGLALYFLSPKVDFSSATMSNPTFRFFTVEHAVMMLIAVILITIGNRHSKNGNARKVFWFYLIALIIILAAIPWPFRAMLGGSWF